MLDHFSAPNDPRQAWKVSYPLPEILPVVLCGTLAGGQNFVEIRQWAGHKLDFLRRLLPFARGVPPHDTRNDVMNALDARTFSECFTSGLTICGCATRASIRRWTGGGTRDRIGRIRRRDEAT